MKRVLKTVNEVFKVTIFAIIISTLVSTQIFAFSQVKQTSMENTYHEGNILFVEKVSYNFTDPKLGDVVIINMSNEDNSIIGRITTFYAAILKKINGESDKERIVKRVIGIEGQKIDIINGFVYVDNNKLVEEYVTSPTQAEQDSSVTFPLIVPKGEIFVLGDNRKVSKDSRKFNCVKTKQIEGKVIFKLF